MRRPARPRLFPLFAFCAFFTLLEVLAGLGLRRILPAFQVHRLLLDLRTADDDTAREASLRILGMGTSAVPVLVPSLAESNPVYRKRVLQLLGDFRDLPTLPTFRRFLREPPYNDDDYVRRECVLAIGKLDIREVFQDLVEALDDRSPEVRMEAAGVLGRATPDALLGRLLAALYASAPDVRADLREQVLRRFSLGIAVPCLAATIEHGSTDERREALLLLRDYLRDDVPATDPAIRALAPPLEGASRSRDIEAARAALMCLGRIDPRRAGALALTASQDDSLPDETRTYCLNLLGELKPAGALDAILADLRCGRPAVHTQARDALREVARAEDAVRITACLSGGDFPEETRETFIAILSDVGGAGALPTLLSLLRDPAGAHLDAAQRAITSIAAREGAPCVPLLVEDLDAQPATSYPFVTRVLSDATGYDPSLSDPKALTDPVAVRRERETRAWKSWWAEHASEAPALWRESGEREAMALLADGNAIVRQRALQHLDRIRSEGAAKAALGLLMDPDEYVWGTAADVVARSPSDEVKASLVERLHGTPEEASRAARVISRIPSPAFVEPLLKALERREPEVRETAIEALAAMADGRAAPRLVEALFDDDPDVRAAASFAMSQFTDEPSKPRLLAGLKDSRSDVRKSCATLLGRLGDASVVPDLLPLAWDSTPVVRAYASAALEELTGQHFTFNERTPAQVMREAWEGWWRKTHGGER